MIVEISRRISMIMEIFASTAFRRMYCDIIICIRIQIGR
nr:MAG TPA: hypothetical protein [Caudoviricetes sp.]